MSAPVRLPSSLDEATFTGWVLDLARLHGWMCCHFRPARTRAGWRTAVQGDPGAPDVLLCRRGVVIFAELKTNKGRLRPEQEMWIANLGAFGRVWRPRDADSILAELRDAT